jgi:DNA-binding NtrC family response regulator
VGNHESILRVAPEDIVGRLLVIDDDDGFREALSELLRGAGYEVETADRAATAVRQLQGKKFDAVLSDLVMPGNGHLVVEYVQSHQPHTPVIVISSHESPGQVLAANGAREAVTCLRKPVHFQQIQDALDHAFEHRTGDTR